MKKVQRKHSEGAEKGKGGEGEGKALVIFLM